MSDTIPPPSTTERSADPAPPARRRRTAVIVAVAVGIAVIVVGIVLASSATDDGASPTPAATGSPEELAPFPPAAPTDLEATAKPFAVQLTWSPDETEGSILGYTVYRDGREIGTVTGEGRGRFVDDGAAPLIRYEYAVAAFGEDDLASEPADVRVKTPAAPLADARLEGTFNVKLDQVSSFGYVSTGGDSTGGWSFKPRCARGACNVKAAQVFRGSAPITMSQQFANYRAQGSARLGVRCGGTETTSTYTIQIEVTKAKTIEGVWHAVAFEGTFTHREAPQLGCVSAGADLALSGRLVDL